MKRGIEELGAEFVLDEFHISEYIKRMVKAIGEETAEQEIREIIKGGKKKELEEWEERKRDGGKAGNQAKEGDEISNRELEGSKKKDGEKRRNNREQYRKSYQSYVVSKVKFIADGME